MKSLYGNGERTCASVAFPLFSGLTAYLQGLVLQLRTTSLFKLCVILKQGAKHGDDEGFGDKVCNT